MQHDARIVKKGGRVQKIMIIGASGHAKVIAGIVECEGKHTIAGYVDKGLPIGSMIAGYPVLGDDDDLPRLISDIGICGAILGIGDNFVRSKVTARIAALGLPLVSTIHPKAYIGNDVSIGEGSVVMAGAAINCCSTVGKSCILFANSVLDHDSSMGDYSSLGHNASTGGNCHVGDYTAVCIGANIIHGVTVGGHSVVGAGATVLQNVDALTVTYGSPAKYVRSREIGDRYL